MVDFGCLFGACSFKGRDYGKSPKIEAVKSWVQLSFVAEVRSFVGLASHYRRFEKNFTSISTHLTRLTRKWRRLNGPENVIRVFNSRLFDHNIYSSTTGER